MVMPYGFSSMKRIAQNTCVRSRYWRRAVGGGLVVVTLEALRQIPLKIPRHLSLKVTLEPELRQIIPPIASKEPSNALTVH